MYEIEKFTHAGMTVRLYHDEDAQSPDSWDNIGTLIHIRPFEWNIGEPMEYDEQDAMDRGGPALLVRYLRMTQGVTAIPWRLEDYGSNGARITPTSLDDERASGVITTSHERVTELCGDGAKYHAREWIKDALRGDLKLWDAYAEGRVAGYVVEDASGEHVDSCWGFYPDDDDKSDGLEYVRAEARSAAEYEHEQRETNARLYAFKGVV